MGPRAHPPQESPARRPLPEEGRDCPEPPLIPRAPAGFVSWLTQRRQEIVAEWVDLAARLGPHYRSRSTEELTRTISRSFDVNLLAMKEGRPEHLDSFLDYITHLRLEAGFPLYEVQKAFDLFRVVLLPKVFDASERFDSFQALNSVHAVVSHQIYRFSDQFQRMHEQAIRSHAESLKKQVLMRGQELEASERLHKTLVEEINDGYLVVQDMRIALANRAFCEMHGAAWRQTVSQPFLSFVAPEDREKVLLACRQTLAGQPDATVLEYLRQGPRGERGVTEIKARVLDMGQGPVIIGICRDITQRVEMERKVRDHERMAYVGHLTASLSHELRNPLSTIKMNLQILSRKGYLAAVDRDRLEMAVHEVSRLEGILHQLLDVAKPLSLSLGSHDVNAMAQGCLDLLHPKLAERRIKLRRLLARDLPLLRVDKDKLEQALLNLLLNAMEAVGEGGGITVGTRARDADQGPAWELFVRDNGPGLGPEDLAQIFTPFFTRKTYGTGLGLTNVKRIAEAHGGSITVESAPGRGSRFSLLLPRSP